MASGKIFDIQRFCVDDGPGIRTTVFFKGCPLNCIWCHNPESKSSDFQVLLNSDRCKMCSRCFDICNNHIVVDGVHTIDREKCQRCMKCANECEYGALSHIGMHVDSDYVIENAMRDLDFYKNSNGGLTLSGGEPLVQWEFALEILQKAKEKGIHTAVETCGYVKSEHLIKMLPYIDLFLYDFKESDEERHKKYTGVSQELIMKNLSIINDYGSRIILRCPIVPTYNDREEHLIAIANIANSFSNIEKVEVMPYHILGKAKYEQLGINYSLNILEKLSDDQRKESIKIISMHTKVIVE